MIKKKNTRLPQKVIGEIADFFNRDAQTVNRWIKNKDPILTSDPVKEILKKYNIKILS